MDPQNSETTPKMDSNSKDRLKETRKIILERVKKIVKNETVLGSERRSQYENLKKSIECMDSKIKLARKNFNELREFSNFGKNFLKDMKNRDDKILIDLNEQTEIYQKCFGEKQAKLNAKLSQCDVEGMKSLHEAVNLFFQHSPNQEKLDSLLIRITEREKALEARQIANQKLLTMREDEYKRKCEILEKFLEETEIAFNEKFETWKDSKDSLDALLDRIKKKKIQQDEQEEELSTLWDNFNEKYESLIEKEMTSRKKITEMANKLISIKSSCPKNIMKNISTENMFLARKNLVDDCGNQICASDELLSNIRSLEIEHSSLLKKLGLMQYDMDHSNCVIKTKMIDEEFARIENGKREFKKMEETLSMMEKKAAIHAKVSLGIVFSGIVARNRKRICERRVCSNEMSSGNVYPKTTLFDPQILRKLIHLYQTANPDTILSSKPLRENEVASCRTILPTKLIREDETANLKTISPPEPIRESDVIVSSSLQGSKICSQRCKSLSNTIKEEQLHNLKEILSSALKNDKKEEEILAKECLPVTKREFSVEREKLHWKKIFHTRYLDTSLEGSITSDTDVMPLKTPNMKTNELGSYPNNIFHPSKSINIDPMSEEAMDAYLNKARRKESDTEEVEQSDFSEIPSFFD